MLTASARRKIAASHPCRRTKHHRRVLRTRPPLDIDAAITRARRQIELVQEYRTRLIADVVTGKLDVRAAAAQLPDEADEEEPIDGDGLVLDNMNDGSSDVSQLLEEGQATERW